MIDSSVPHISYIFCSSVFFFFKQKTAYEMRISDWSSDVCSSDLTAALLLGRTGESIARGLGVAGLQSVSARHPPQQRVPVRLGDCRALPHRLAPGALFLPVELPVAVGEIADRPFGDEGEEIGRAHVCTPVTNAHLVSRLMLENEKHESNKRT